jgi:uncharacterized protein YqgV (UPF0045/DUF77 family)
VKLRLEFTVEPFVEGRPGTHVRAAIEEARRLGFDPDVGPFATAVEGESGLVVDAVAAITQAAFAAGATRVAVTVSRPGKVAGSRTGGPRPPILDRLIDQVERELGARLGELSREGKQRAVKRLDECGAFDLRRSTEAVADALGVSRITVYNYLNKLP